LVCNPCNLPAAYFSIRSFKKQEKKGSIMHLLKKPLQALAIALCLIVCFSFLTLDARAHELEDIPAATEDESFVFHPDNDIYTPPIVPENVHSIRGDPFANEVIRLINIERFHGGMPPVEVQPVLTQAARIRAEESSRLDSTYFLNNIRPDGRQWYTIFPEVNLPMRRSSENVARGFSTPDEVVRAWMESPGYRDNLLSPEWETTGIWASTNDWGRIDVVQLFYAGEDLPIINEYPPASVNEAPPVADEYLPATTDDMPSDTKHPPAINVDPPTADKYPPAVDEYPPAVDEDPPAIDEDDDFISHPDDDETYLPPAQDYNVYPVRGDSFISEVIRLVNIERFHKGMPPVEVHPVLTEAARKRTQESLRLDNMHFFNHIRPDGQQWYTVFSDVNLSLRRSSENVARGFSTPDQVVRAWMESPSHRDNLLSPEWVTTGVWMSINGWGIVDVVQLFCADVLMCT